MTILFPIKVCKLYGIDAMVIDWKFFYNLNQIITIT